MSRRTRQTENRTAAIAERDPAADVAAKLQALADMDYGELRDAWRRLYRTLPPKRVSRDLLILGVAWKIQAQAYGGLGGAMKRRLAALADELGRHGDVARNRITRLRPGAKLIREWRGETHTVIVHDDSFEWQGKRWPSLSMIAREITGSHWSGPRFFGLNDKARQKPDAGNGDPDDA